MPSINLLHVGKRSKEKGLIEIRTVHTPLADSLAPNNNLVVQLGDWGSMNFRAQNLAIIWGSPPERQSQTSLQLCSPTGGGGGGNCWSQLALKRIRESAWGCPVHNMETVTTVTVATSAPCRPPKEGTPVPVTLPVWNMHVSLISPKQVLWLQVCWLRAAGQQSRLWRIICPQSRTCDMWL